MVERVGAATIVANKATWPATVPSIEHHPEDENVENQDQARHKEIRVQTLRDGFDPAPRAKNGPRWPRKHLRRPGGGRPRQELNTTINTSKPEKNSTLGGVNVEGTEPAHASLFTVRGRICARRDDSFDSRVELLVDCGATSDFMSMQTAKRARLPLYKLTNPGHVLTAGGVQVEVRYYTRAYVRVGQLVFRPHFKVLEILPDVVLGLPWLRSYNPTVNWKERHADIQHGSSSYRCLLTSQDIPPSCSSKPLRSWTFFRYFHPVPRKRVRLEILPHMPRNALIYTRRHTSRMVLICTMSPKRKMVSPMRSVAIWRSSTSRCQTQEGYPSS